VTWAWASPVCSTSSPRRNVGIVHQETLSRTKTFCLNFSHGQLPTYDWRGVRNTHHRGGRQKDQATDLGHSGPRALPGCHTLLLPGSSRCSDGLRYYTTVGKIRLLYFLYLNLSISVPHTITWAAGSPTLAISPTPALWSFSLAISRIWRALARWPTRRPRSLPTRTASCFSKLVLWRE